MIKLRIVVASFIAISLLFVSCGSTPTDEVADDAVEAEKVVEETSQEASENILEQIESSRKQAIDAGAEQACPNAFKAAEDEYDSIKKAAESGEDVSARQKELLARYQALKAYADAVSKKAKIDENNFASYNQNAYNEGSSLIEELASSEDYGTDWNKKAVTANGKMDLVLVTAYKSIANAERTEAFKAKKDADSVKCAVSRKSEYEEYVANFKSGDQNYVTGNPEGAFENYKKAKEGFATLYTEVSTAREKAQAAIDEAKQRVAESETTAQWADKEKPLSDDEQVEGIEDADTKLLEEDDFSESESVATEIEESIDESALLEAE